VTADWIGVGWSSASLSVGHITQARLPAITTAAIPAPKPAIDCTRFVMVIPSRWPPNASASKKP
jgi:hypothetical protein